MTPDTIRSIIREEFTRATAPAINLQNAFLTVPSSPERSEVPPTRDPSLHRRRTAACSSKISKPAKPHLCALDGMRSTYDMSNLVKQVGVREHSDNSWVKCITRGWLLETLDKDGGLTIRLCD